MKTIICCFTLLFIVVGCKKDNPNVNKSQETASESLLIGKPFTNSIGMKLVYIPPGEFMMGSRDSAAEVARKGASNEPELFTNEHPQHRVKITNGFFMGSTEVTQAQYREIIGQNPSRFEQEDNPVELVSWNDAVKFCKRLSEKEGRTYRLPTEAEWEYACRAATTTPFYTGETINTTRANYAGKYAYGNGTKGVDRKKPISVGSFPPNAFGLHDMHGNVWAWCQDWYGKDYYSTSPAADPQGPSTGVFRVFRGGSWAFNPGGCRSAYRRWGTPEYRSSDSGFRILLDL